MAASDECKLPSDCPVRWAGPAVACLWAAAAAAGPTVSPVPAVPTFPDTTTAPAAEDKKLVEAELLADVTAIRPGGTFRVGVLLRIRAGWHVYWLNPGDAGLATSVALRLPNGFRAGELRWPAPATFGQPGGIVGYGYEKSVLLWAQVAAPKTAEPGRSVELRADVAWLACKENCIPGEANVGLRLPVAKASRPAHAELFDRWRKRTPVPAGRSPLVASVRTTGRIPPGKKSGTFTVELAWTTPPRKVDCYPAARDDLLVENLSARTDRRRTHVALTVTPLVESKPAATALRIVAVYVDKKGSRHPVAVTLPLRKPDTQRNKRSKP